MQYTHHGTDVHEMRAFLGFCILAGVLFTRAIINLSYIFGQNRKAEGFLQQTCLGQLYTI